PSWRWSRRRRPAPRRGGCWTSAAATAAIWRSSRPTISPRRARGSRRRASGSPTRPTATASFTHLHPKDVPGAIVSIDAMEPQARWEWGGPHWREHVKTDVAAEIRGCEIQTDDPDAVSQKWATVLDRPREKADGGWRIAVDGGEIRFTAPADGRGEGLGTFDVAVRDPEAVRARAKARGCTDADGNVVLCGTRVRLVRA